MAENTPKKKPVRVWADGCFDMCHWGHMNALRQSKALGDILVVGCHSDAEISRHKGPPVMNEQERYNALRACKWVDEVVENAPYVTTLETLDKYNIDFCTHGEDITLDENGVDCYKSVKEAGRYKTIKRTEGVSTTDLVGRMLLYSRAHFKEISKDEMMKQAKRVHFPSTSRVMQFSEGNHPPKKTDKIVYIDGGFDLFHAGHVSALKEAKSLGDYLIVGLHSDQEINKQKGYNLPIMNIYERTLSVLSCRYVNEVIVGAPWGVTKELIEQFNISVVACGSSGDFVEEKEEHEDPYAVARKLGVLVTFKSPNPKLKTTEVLRRVMKNLSLYRERNKKKLQKEAAHEEK